MLKLYCLTGQFLLNTLFTLLQIEYTTHEVTFKMDEEFHVPWERGGLITHMVSIVELITHDRIRILKTFIPPFPHSQCSRPDPNIIICTTKEPIKGWDLQTRMIFSDVGLVDEKTNLNAMISTNKTYVRLKEDGHEDIDEDEAGLLEDTDTSSTPPDLEDDWFAWE